ncbi:hypothetical protein BBD42_02050 [Paenibacillus sp. BIHB 4019]|uniref:Copper amine oxidase n=1 Tax=Paenibacillus sp. BIHB 4019 TaxID=1870819 RepID=A0A1B2DCF6_9BACL|nr:hypothetical protein BBD42_02050 [Paenibacillus sp. BIHB 4019]
MFVFLLQTLYTIMQMNENPLLLFYQKEVCMLSGKWRKVSFLFIIIGLLMASPGLKTAAAAEEDAAASYQIVALGDSLTAGYEFGFDAKSVPYGYVEHVYEQALFQGLRAEYVNYGLLGLTSTGFSHLLGAVKDGKSATVSDVQPGLKDPRAASIIGDAAKIGSSIRGADLIVMTIGGNDLLGVAAQITSTTTDEEKAQLLQAALTQYETGLTAGLQAVTSIAPKAKLVIADQYMPIPATITVGSLSFPLPPDAARLREFELLALSQLNEKLKTIVAAIKAEGIDISITEVSKPFVGKELEYTSIANSDVHPTRLGYAAMGHTYSTTIWNKYLNVRTRPANVPVSVVVRGKELPAASPATMKSNRTFVPMRDITDAIGAKLVWNKTSQTATVSYNKHTVAFTIGSSTILVDGVKKKLNSPAAYLQKNGKEQKTYLPLAVLSEELGLQVTYRSTLQAVFIN